MPKITKAEEIVAYLESVGCHEIASPSRKYRKFTGPQKLLDDAFGRRRFYWVGKAGALRIGRTASDSISLTK